MFQRVAIIPTDQKKVMAKNLGHFSGEWRLITAYLSLKKKKGCGPGKMPSQPCSKLLCLLQSITSGVLQGSTLGPFLFLVYVNDLFLNAKCELFMYVDDMTIIVPGKSRAEVIETANKELGIVSSWLTKHKLIVNPAKTKYMIFYRKSHKVHKIQNFVLKFWDNRFAR